MHIPGYDATDGNGAPIYNELGRSTTPDYTLPAINAASAFFGVRAMNSNGRMSAMTTTDIFTAQPLDHTWMKSVSLVAPTYAFNVDGDVYDPETIKLTALAFGFKSPVYQWYDGDAMVGNPFTGPNWTLTPFEQTTKIMRVEVREADGEARFSDSKMFMRLVQGRDGAPAPVRAELIVDVQESTIYKYANGGIVNSIAKPRGRARVMVGDADVTAQANFSLALNRCTGSINNADNNPWPNNPKGYFELPTADVNAYAIIVANYNGVRMEFMVNITMVTVGFEIVDTLPLTNNFVGRIVFLTSNEKLYTYTANGWEYKVPVQDIAGQLNSEQIADKALTIAKFAAELEPVRLVTAVPASKITNVIYNTITGKTYRWNGIAYELQFGANDSLPAGNISGTLAPAVQKAIDLANLAGKIVDTQITDGSVSTPKLAAGAVTATKIDTGAVTAGKIDVGAVTADKIAANAVTSNKILAGSIGAKHIEANSIGAGQIAAAAITADELAAGAITTEKLVIGSRQIYAQEFNFRWDRTNNVLRWDQGSIFWVDDFGARRITTIAAGSYGYPGQYLHVYWIQGMASFSFASGDWTAGLANNCVEICLWQGGSVVIARVGAVIIDGSRITARSITAEQILANTIGANELSAGAVTADKIQAGAITTAKLEAGAVTAEKLTSGRIISSSGQIGDLVVNNAHIANLTVGTSKIQDNAVSDLYTRYTTGFTSAIGYNTFQDVQILDVFATGRPVLVRGSCVTEGTNQSTSTRSVSYNVRLYKDGGILLADTVHRGEYRGYSSTDFVETVDSSPGNGWVRYYLHVFCNYAEQNIRCDQRLLTGMVLKK